MVVRKEAKNMVNYGYIRKEFPIETIKQIQMLFSYQCEEIFIEGTNLGEETELIRLLATIQENDTVIVYHTCVFEKNLSNYAKMIEEFMDKQVNLVSFKEEIDTLSEKNYYLFVKQIAEMERNVLKKKTIYGLKVERNDGRVGGRPKISECTIKTIISLRKKQDLPLRKIAEICQVSLGTVHKYLREDFSGY